MIQTNPTRVRLVFASPDATHLIMFWRQTPHSVSLFSCILKYCAFRGVTTRTWLAGLIKKKMRRMYTQRDKPSKPYTMTNYITAAWVSEFSVYNFLYDFSAITSGYEGKRVQEQLSHNCRIRIFAKRVALGKVALAGQFSCLAHISRTRLWLIVCNIFWIVLFFLWFVVYILVLLHLVNFVWVKVNFCYLHNDRFV